MENKEFYSPIKSLVNIILTSEKKINQDGEFIPLTQEFIDSLINIDDDYNLYFLSCIENFLSNCSKEEKVDVIKVLCENEDLLHGVSIMNTIIKNPKSLKQSDFSDTVDSVLSNYLTDGELHPIITLAIYFYIESVAKIEVNSGEIALSDYEKIVEFHSIKRDLKDLFSF
jgi:hypothetical protein